MEPKARRSRSAEPGERTLLAVVSDLLIEVRIEAAAQRQGLAVQTASPDTTVGAIRQTHPALVIVDLAESGIDLSALAAAAKEVGVPVVGFHPHVDVDLRREAHAAGIDHVYPRSRFLGELPKILAERLPS